MLFDNLYDFVKLIWIFYNIGLWIIFSLIYYYFGIINHTDLKFETDNGICLDCACKTPLFTAFYYSLISQTTIGYGEICPKSYKARKISFLHAFLMHFQLIIFIYVL